MATALLAGAVLLRAQELPTFRTGVDAVSVDAFVTDRTGRVVSDLRQDEFDILEDGKPQQLTSFALVDIPIERPDPYSATAPEPDVATNDKGEGRLYVIVLDELCPSEAACHDHSDGELALRARQILRQFIENYFQPTDVGLVVSLGRARAGDMQDFTSNRRLLLKAIDAYSGGFYIPAAGATLPEMPRRSLDPGGSLQEPFDARRQARALRSLMESLANIKGRRKAVLYITHVVGESAHVLGAANIGSVLDYQGGVRSLQFDDLRAAMTAAMRGGVAVYAIDPAGIDPFTSGLLEIDRMQELRTLSSATGGYALVNSNSVEQLFTRMVQENSTYYVLGFSSSNGKRDGRYRHLQVRVARPGLTVRHRDGYIAPAANERPPKPDTQASPLAPSIRDRVALPLSNAAVPLSAFATALRGKDKTAQVLIAVSLDPTRLGLAIGPGDVTGQVEVAAVAISAAGKVAGGRQERFALKLTPERWHGTAANGLHVVTSMPLPPGRYQLRIAGGNTASQAAGSVMYDLDVPDFTKKALMISAPVVMTATGQGTAVVSSVAASLLPAGTSVPTVDREFVAGSRVSLYVEVYDNTPGVHALEADAGLVDENGRPVGDRHGVQQSHSIAASRLSLDVPLAVPPGRYAIRVTARAGAVTVSRDIPIRIR